MRPEILFPLFGPVTKLKGIGSRLEPLFERLAGPQIIDLLWHAPVSVIDRTRRPQLTNAPLDTVVTLKVVVDRHLPPPTKRLPYKVRCHYETGFVTLVFFHPNREYLQKILPEDARLFVSGKLESFNDELQIIHPDYVVPEREIDRLPKIEPIYPLTSGLSQKVVGQAVRQATHLVPRLPEWIEPALLRREAWPSWRKAVRAVHQPQAMTDLSPDTPARMRLAYDELLAHQLVLAVIRQRAKKGKGRALTFDGALMSKARAQLPYTLTRSQERALDEIRSDLQSASRMVRLLQGDVGSGKTIVAFMAMLMAIEAGTQTAFMAPTEILAQQHFDTLEPLAASLGLKVALLMGRTGRDQRTSILRDVESGDTQVLIGTHALFQDQIAFRDLGLAVVDEQHRFGVHQRMQLRSKGDATNVLVMTATPIPRTLTLAVYGDMDVSRLTERPPGRKPIKTTVVSMDRLDEVIAALQRALDAGESIFWVCPLVEESDVLDATAAEERHRHLAEVFGSKVGLLHGRLSPQAKDRAVDDFLAGRTRILVSTSVIEVGIDIPSANVMAIEQAERFGLAQLHQLRGRVGRGERQATCLLIYKPPLSDTARQRLKVLRDTGDGFVIAEEDLRLRGAGDLLGTRQSGMPEFRLAKLEHHQRLLAIARDDALLALDKDPTLTSDRGQALKILLYLFRRDEALEYFRAG